MSSGGRSADFQGDLCCEQDQQEGDWAMLQVDAKGPLHFRRSNHDGGLYVAFLFESSLAQFDPEGSHVHRKAGGGHGPRAWQVTHLGGCCRNLYGVPGIGPEEEPEGDRRYCGRGGRYDSTVVQVDVPACRETVPEGL